MKYVVPFLLILILSQCKNPKEHQLSVCSFNVRYENSRDSMDGNGWHQRCPIICDIIEFNDFDVIGAQEVLYNQLNDLNQKLKDYDYVGVGRDDGKTKGEYAPIFFKKALFTLLDSGHFWLSEITDRPNKGWDAALPRICTWVKLKVQNTGFEFWCFNLHMDHIGTKARENSAKLVVQKIKEMCKNKPVILTGDFNVDQKSKNYEVIVNSGILNDSYNKAEVRYATNGTFNDFKPNMKTDSRIDHIFVSPSLIVDRYGILTDTYRTEIPETKQTKSGNFPKEVSLRKYNARTPSDHFPVKAIISYTN
ncbi:endonuclease/exonuclease/phosphatase family protein [Marinilabilia salmonicolor]|uniref:endonuclease/exonuclease/phosphatase family protein n=1 Tax=Marinilabilia salmonicolor TaxID=989 RepID=UPI0002FC8264|nr:endonuclease/exonuclease/phosphatase family protein [Marinilabilia salmonicolor]